MVDTNKVRNPVETDEDCECRFTIDEGGEPTVLCPDAQSQERVVQALEEHGDVVVRVSPVLIESGQEDELDQGGVNLDQDVEPEEEVGFADLGDDDDTDEEDEG